MQQQQQQPEPQYQESHHQVVPAQSSHEPMNQKSMQVTQNNSQNIQQQ